MTETGVKPKQEAGAYRQMQAAGQHVGKGRTGLEAVASRPGWLPSPFGKLEFRSLGFVCKLVLVNWCFGQSAEWSIEMAVAGGR